MWELEVAGISFFDVFYNFFLYSFFGWIYESTYVSVREKKWVNRGFLNGPVIPIYGAAATLLYIAFFNDSMVEVTSQQTILSVLMLFATGMILASVLEFVTSWTMEKLFHAKWWDYSECFWNIQGRVCLKASLFWGFLSVVMAKLIQPAMGRLLDKLPRPAGEYVGYVIFAVFTADFTLTVIATLQLDHLLRGMERLREELYEAVEGRKWHELTTDFRERLEDSKVAEYLESIKERTEKQKEEVKERFEGAVEKIEEAVDRFEDAKGRMEENYQNFLQKYHYNRKNYLQEHIFKRLMKAYPNMQVKQKMGAFHDLREGLLKRNHKKSVKNGEDAEE